MRSVSFAVNSFLFFVGGVIAASNPSTSDIGKSYRLYHTLGHGSKLTPRGKITIAPSDDESSTGSGGLVATFYPDDTQLDVAAFDQMVENHALYTLVIVEEGKDEKSPPSQPPSNNHYVSASVPGCSVRRSNLREEITLSVNPTGKLMSVSYRPLISPLAPKTCEKLKTLSEKPEVIFGRMGENDGDLAKEKLMPFKTTVAFESHKPMMAIPTLLPKSHPPPGLKWYKRSSKNNPSPVLGDIIGDEQPSGFKSSFLYKYWYIILPLAIAGLFGGVVEEEPAGQHGGQAKGGVGAAAAGLASAEVARQRRGKRD